MALLRISTEQESDGSWSAVVDDCPGVIAYALSEERAIDTVVGLWKSIRQELKESRGAHILPWF